MWLVHLVQLKKLFLKLSAYVELYLQQDWSLLPVPDFKLVAKSENDTAHLNFMVAAVLLTATHSGRNFQFENILDSIIPSNLRKDIQEIQEAFSIALESKSKPNSPRKTSLNNKPPLATLASPKVLFPSTLSNETRSPFEMKETKDQDHGHCLDEIALQEIETKEKDEAKTEIISMQESENNNQKQEQEHDCNNDNNNNENYNENNNAELLKEKDEQLINFENEVKILEIKMAEMERLISKYQEKEILNSEIEQNNLGMRIKLLESQEQLDQLRERREFERIERNSLMVAFDHERQILEETIDRLRKDYDVTICNLRNHCELLQEALSKLTEEKKNLESEVCEAKNKLKLMDESENLNIKEFDTEKFSQETAENSEETIETVEDINMMTEQNNFYKYNLVLISELTRSNKDNSKLVNALKKARDHIIYQDSLIKELQETLQSETNEQTPELKNL